MENTLKQTTSQLQLSLVEPNSRSTSGGGDGGTVELVGTEELEELSEEDLLSISGGIIGGLLNSILG